ncbi:MAG TPA: hypothetical protein VNN72_16140 [Polyangiaceae bacterium]|nr:hypothetical protein [Polyangiaceae bacterium]
MRWTILLGALVCVAGCAGKSQSDHDAKAGSGAAAGSGGSGGSGGTGGTGGTGGSIDEHCTDLAGDAPKSTVAWGGDDPPPTPQGGVIASGTYYLDSQTLHGQAEQCVDVTAKRNALGISSTELVRFEATSDSGGHVESALDATAQGMTTHTTGAGTYATSGSLISVTETCGNASAGMDAPVAVPYTASSDILIVFDDGTSVCSPVITVFRRL